MAANRAELSASNVRVNQTNREINLSENSPQFLS